MNLDPASAALYALVAICLVLVGAILTPGTVSVEHRDQRLLAVRQHPAMTTDAERDAIDRAEAEAREEAGIVIVVEIPREIVGSDTPRPPATPDDSP